MSFQSSASTALPTHDPASVLPQGAPEPPRALHGAPRLAPSTSMAGGTVVTRVRLPTVAESAELLAGWSTMGQRGVYERQGRRVWWMRATAGGASE